jgi:predicted small lipoprotein YifL
MRLSLAAAALMAATLAGCDRATPLEPAALTAAPSFKSGSKPVTTRTNIRRDVAFESWSPCTLEPIEVTGTFHMTVTTTVTNGEVSYRAHQNTQGMGGRGLYSGRLYRLISIRQENGRQETSPVWTENGYEFQSGFTWKVVSQGRADNFYSTLKFTVVYDPDDPERSGFTYDKSETGCRG